MENTPRKCWFRDFWHKWGAHIDAATILTVLGVCATVLVNGFNFISETKALPAHIKMQDNKIAIINIKANLEMLRGDRTAQNMELLMRAMKVMPLPKTDSEKMLESKITMKEKPLEALDQSESINDNE